MKYKKPLRNFLSALLIIAALPAFSFAAAAAPAIYFGAFSPDRGYQDSLYPGILVSLRAKRSNLPHFEIASAQSASQ